MYAKWKSFAYEANTREWLTYFITKYYKIDIIIVFIDMSNSDNLMSIISLNHLKLFLKCESKHWKKKDTWVHGISFVTFGWLFFCKKKYFLLWKIVDKKDCYVTRIKNLKCFFSEITYFNLQPTI
jgi:hypothetical protein